MVPHREECTDVYWNGIVLQLESCPDQFIMLDKEPLVNKDGSPICGPTATPLRNIPSLPRELSPQTPRSRIECYLRDPNIKLQDLVDRWPTKTGRTRFSTMGCDFRDGAYLPVFAWASHNRLRLIKDLQKLTTLTQWQRNNNTCGIPLLPGYAVQPRLPYHAGKWEPKPQRVYKNGDPHVPGEKMAERDSTITNAIERAGAEGCHWTEIVSRDVEARKNSQAPLGPDSGSMTSSEAATNNRQEDFEFLQPLLEYNLHGPAQ